MSTGRVLVLLGSPRKNGNSAILAGRVAEGAKSAGAEVKTFYLHGMNIQPCSACDVCREGTGAECNIEDDMQKLYPELRQADALVIASPVYWFTVSAQTKLFIDRCYALGGPEGHALKGKQIVIVLTYEGADPFSAGAVNALRTFQDMFAYIGAPIVGMLYGTAYEAGEIRKNRELMERAYTVGKELAQS